MNTIKISTAAVAAVTLLALPSGAAGQWSLEARLGSGIPTGEVTDAPFSQTAGLGFAAEAMYTTSPRLTLYGGVSRHSFNCDDCFTDVTSTGFQSGVKVNFGQNGRALPWARGGLLLHDLDSGSDTSGWGLGFDTGVGVDWRVSEPLSVVPALRYSSYTVEDLTLSYVTIDLGLHVHLSR